MGGIKSFYLILQFVAIACVQAKSTLRYGWAPDTESVFRLESQVLTGIPDIQNSHYSGIKFTAQARVQAFPDYTLRIKLDQLQFITLNGQISLTEANRVIGNGGIGSGAKEHLPNDFRKFLEEPMLVHLKRGLVQSFFVSEHEPVAVTNIKRSLLAQLQLDLSGSQLIETARNPICFHKPNVQPPSKVMIPYYSLLEKSLHGNCRSIYNINPLSSSRAIELEQELTKEEQAAQLSPSVGGKTACDGKKYFEIVKIRDLDSCDFSPVFQKVSGAVVNFDTSKSNAGNLMAVSNLIAYLY